MKSKSDLVFSVVTLQLILIVCLSIASALDTGSGTVAPLIHDNPVSSDKFLNKDLKKIETRFNDPPPEYYKGPSSSGNYDSFDLKYNGQSHRPTSTVSGNYFNPYLNKHGFYGTINPKDRISIGGGYYSGSEFNANGYAGSDRVRPYGSPQPVDIPVSNFNGYGYGGGVGGGVGGGSGYEHSYDQGYDGNIWPDKMHHLSKSHFLPLAGAALIGIAAALLVNPVLLQLGTVAGKRRRRRDTRQSLPPTKLYAHKLAYNRHIQQ